MRFAVRVTFNASVFFAAACAVSVGLILAEHPGLFDAPAYHAYAHAGPELWNTDAAEVACLGALSKDPQVSARTALNRTETPEVLMGLSLSEPSVVLYNSTGHHAGGVFDVTGRLGFPDGPYRGPARAFTCTVAMHDNGHMTLTSYSGRLL